MSGCANGDRSIAFLQEIAKDLEKSTEERQNALSELMLRVELGEGNKALQSQTEGARLCIWISHLAQCNEDHEIRTSGGTHYILGFQDIHERALNSFERTIDVLAEGSSAKERRAAKSLLKEAIARQTASESLLVVASLLTADESLRHRAGASRSTRGFVGPARKIKQPDP